MTVQPPLASRMARIRPFRAMDLLARARALEAAGRDIVHMEVGEPDFPTPGPVVEAARTALGDAALGYTPAMGLPALRQAIAGHYGERFGCSVDPGRIVVTPGASGALQAVLAVLAGPGDEVLVTDPGYPCNRNFVHLLEARPVPVPVRAGNGWQPTLQDLEAVWSPRVRVVMFASPMNPTGTLLEEGRLRELVSFVEDRGAVVVMDEIYQRMLFDSAPFTALSLSDRLYVVDSFSKYFGMTGWRIGWLVAPPAQVEAIDRVVQNLFLAAPTLSQHAALAAFLPETTTLLEKRVAAFRERRDFLLPALEAIGFRVEVPPSGAFYIYADSSRFDDDAIRLCDRLLEQAGVAVTPGADFGEEGAATHVRFAFTTSLDRLREGVERLGRFLAG